MKNSSFASNTFISIIYKYYFGRLLLDYILNNLRNNFMKIVHNDISLKISAPNALNHYRVKTFSSKEPETLEWIDRFLPESIFWDIDANVGLYSIFAAKKKV
jgi:hypothetical protein